MKKTIISILIVIVLLAGSVTATYFIQQNKYESDMAEAAANAEALQAQLTAFEKEDTINKEILTDMLCRLDYNDKPVYVIGHKTPDSDTVCSAIGMAYLLKSLGISAEARIPGELNLESQFIFSELKYSAPDILKDASDKQLWLVDHSASTQMVNGAEKARIVGITDHHGIGDAETSETICVLSCPAGSTCAVVYKLCEVCNVELPKDTASVLLAGLLSDTSNMKSKNATKLDESAFERLKELSGISDTDGLFNGMLEAKLSYKGLDDTEIFYSDYKDYEHNSVKYGIGCIKVARPDQISDMADRMQKVIKSEIGSDCEADFLLYSIYDPDYSIGYMGIAGKDAAFAEKLMVDTFCEKAERQGDFFVFEPSLSRKTDVVPPIDAYLDTIP